ncbi:unnamed protein product, partial [Prunus brigantina]
MLMEGIVMCVGMIVQFHRLRKMRFRQLISFWWFNKPIVFQGAHLPFSFRPSSLFFKQSNIILLDASAWPLPYEYLGVDRCCLMPYFVKKAVICLLMNCDPLSETACLLSGYLLDGKERVGWLVGKIVSDKEITTK